MDLRNKKDYTHKLIRKKLLQMPINLLTFHNLILKYLILKLVQEKDILEYLIYFGFFRFCKLLRILNLLS